MPDTSLAGILADLRPYGDALTTTIPPGWMQGRTAYGGVTAGLLLGTTRTLYPDLPPIRSALINFTAPVGESPHLSARILRQGRNVTTVEARAEVDGQTAATATFSFGAARQSEVRYDRPAPEAPAPDATEPYIPEAVRDFAPAFQRHFDTRLIAGDRPLAGAPHGYTRIWARHADPAARDGAASLLCLADILPPAVYPMLRNRGPNSSMTWICNFLDADLTSDGGWWQMETDLTAARDGYSSQVMRAWNSRGQLVIDGMQAVAIFV